MMKLNSPLLFAIAFILAVIIIAGCLDGTECPVEVSQTEGVVVERFQPSYDLVTVDGTVTLQMDLRNRGTALAEDVSARLWSYGGFSLLDDDVKELDPLNPPDLSVCSAGDTIPVQWTLEAGCDPMGSTLSAYVDYTYISESHATVLLASHDEAERIRGEFALELTHGENVPSAGPIQVEVEALQNEPVIISPTTTSLDIRIMFRNQGSGMAGSYGDGNIDTVNLTIEGPCEFIRPVVNKKTLNWGVGGDDDSPMLTSGGQEALKVANLEYTGNTSTLVRDYCTIRATAKYNYRIVAATEGQIGVTGTNCQVCMCRHPDDPDSCAHLC